LDIVNLNDSEVQALISSLKNCSQSIPTDMPFEGRIKDDTPVVDFKNHIEYILHRYRNPIQSSRFSLHIRFKETNDILIRVDINNGAHTNPDGKKIGQNHMHIYSNRDIDRKDLYAVELPDEISDLDSLFSALVQFLSYTNTSDYPV
jgi:hypothetical protein